MLKIGNLLIALTLAGAAAGCDAGAAPAPAATVAPVSTAVATAKAASSEAKKLVVDKAGSKVEFLMEAPEEKIHGRAEGALSGELAIDFNDLSKSTGTVTVDLDKLVLSQARVDKAGKIGEEKTVEKQNEHARTWLEISPDTPADQREKHRITRFAITSVRVEGEKDLGKMTGADRKVMLEVTGTFQLHQHDVQKSASLEATFHVEGDKPVSVRVKTVKPIVIGLAEHDVKPRDAFGKLALKTLDALAPKVAKEAPITLDFTARLAP